MMKKTARSIALVVAVLLLAGCGNLWAQYYTDRLGGRSVAEFEYLIPYLGEPQVVPGTNIATDAQAFRENGYANIGFSSFNAGGVNVGGAVAHGRKIGAEVVVVYSAYTKTVSGSTSYTVQNPSQTVTTYHSGSAYGPDNNPFNPYASYSGTSTTTVPGGYSTYQIPYSVDRYDYFATFWVKMKPPRLGVGFQDLPAEVRKDLERNRGVLVDYVMKNSPAFYADLLAGDVITNIGGDSVLDSQSFYVLLGKHAGDEVDVKFIRKREPRSVSIHLQDSSY